MDCPQAQELICAALESGALDGEAERHLAECPACRAFRDDVTRHDADLRLALDPSVADVVAERTIVALRREPPAATSRLRFFPLLAAAAAGFFIAIGLAAPWTRPAEHVVYIERPTTGAGQVEQPVKVPMARLVAATGTVESSTTGETWTAIAPGKGCEMDTHVRCAPGAKAEFALSDTSIVRLDAGTRCFFGKFRKFNLEEGRVYAQAVPGRASFEIRTGNACVAIAGTTDADEIKARRLRVVDVMRPPETEKKVVELLTEILVIEGTVAVKCGKKETNVAGPSEVRVVDDEIREPRALADTVLPTRWVHDLLVKHGADDPELRARVETLIGRLGGKEGLAEAALRAMGDTCSKPAVAWIQGCSLPTEAARRRETARIVSDIASVASIPGLIDLLEDHDAEVRRTAASALVRLTATDLGCTDNYWGGTSPSCEDGVKRWRDWLDGKRPNRGVK